MANRAGSRDAAWVGTISDDLEMKGPMPFTRARLKRQEQLFAHRSALFYTPTQHIPEHYVGGGDLDVTLPVVTPDYTDENRAYWNPRLWVDLLQRQSGKLRWRPMRPARILLVRYDSFTIRSDHAAIGMKGLVDALKVRTTGRRDRMYLYYFGAIVDDGPGFIDVTCEQVLVEHPKDARVRVRVSPGASEAHGSTVESSRLPNFAVHRTEARDARPGR
jgi:hypothetical protein